MAQRELFPTDDVPTSGPSKEEFQAQVWNLARRIPLGKVTTYGAIATALGDKRAARQVGWAMSACPADVSAIAHRVVNREGRLTGGWAWGTVEAMRHLLEEEGVTFVDSDLVDLDAHFWVPVADDDDADDLFGVAVTRITDDENEDEPA